MRKSVISSSVSTIVALANDCLVAAGVAVRTHLHHLNMREHLGNWQEPTAGLQRERRTQPSRYQAIGFSSTLGTERTAHTTGNTTNVVSTLWQIALSKRPTQQALALCPAYAAIARISSAQRG